MQVLEYASHYKFCLVDAAVQVGLFSLLYLVEVQGTQPDGQFDGLVLVVIHDGIVMALDTCLKQVEDFYPSEDVLEPNTDVLESTKQKVEPKVEQIGESQEMFVRGLKFVAFLFRFNFIEGKCDVGVLSFFFNVGFFMLKG